MVGDDALRRFRTTVRTEILVRLAGGSRRVGREEIEEWGVRAGLDRGEVAGAFLALAGDAWIGELVFARLPPYRVATPPAGEEVPEWVAVDLEGML